MASYNYTKAADRARSRAERQAEIDAVRKGTWPRDIDDSMRWGASKYFHDAQERAEYAAKMCQAEIDYLDGVERRIREGDSSLAGWEKSNPPPRMDAAELAAFDDACRQVGIAVKVGNGQ